MMDKPTLIKILSKRCGISQKKAARFLDAYAEIAVSAILSGDRFLMRGFGQLVIIHCKQRMARNTYHNKPVVVPAQRRIRFYPGKEVKGGL